MLISPINNYQNGYNTPSFGNTAEKLINKVLKFKGTNPVFSRAETEKILQHLGFEPAPQTTGSHLLWFRGEEFFSFATIHGKTLHFRSIQALKNLLKANGF